MKLQKIYHEPTSPPPAAPAGGLCRARCDHPGRQLEAAVREMLQEIL